MKEKLDIQRVSNPVRQRLATDRKRTLRSGSARAARSVWSESQSRAIEFRNDTRCWGLPARCRGDSIGVFEMAMNTSIQPESESGAEMDWDVLGTCEGLRLLVEMTRIRVSRDNNTRDKRSVSPSCIYRRQRDRQGTVLQAQGKEYRTGIKSGRLSLPVVAFESWVTLLGRSQ